MSWTEEDIRAVMDDHRPGNEGFCLCAWGPMNLTTQIFDADHLIDLLGRRTANLVPLGDFVHTVQQLAYEDGVPAADLPGFTPDLPPPVEEPDYLKYDGVDPSPDSHTCNCLGNGGACWYCYRGWHDECTSDQHGRGSTKCTLGRTT